MTLKKIGKKNVRSSFEFDVYNQLKEFLVKHQIEYESEKIPYTVSGSYLPDFVITKKDGSKIYIEVKGNGRSFDQNVKLKMIAVKEQHPDKDIRIVFYSDGKLGPKRKDGSFMKQSDWAKKHGFVYAIKKVPEDWFQE